MALNILVVDDSSVMRQLIIRTINMCGIEIGEVFEADNGLKGLELLDQNWIDLLLIDINMPIMDGMEMLNLVRKQPETRDLPILIISTESNENRIQKINENRAGFVHKPFTSETLRTRIVEMTGVVESS